MAEVKKHLTDEEMNALEVGQPLPEVDPVTSGQNPESPQRMGGALPNERQAVMFKSLRKEGPLIAAGALSGAVPAAAPFLVPLAGLVGGMSTAVNTAPKDIAPDELRDRMGKYGILGLLTAGLGELGARAIGPVAGALEGTAAKSGVKSMHIPPPTMRRLSTAEEPLGRAIEISRRLMDRGLLGQIRTLPGLQKAIYQDMKRVGAQMGSGIKLIDEAAPAGYMTKDQVRDVIASGLSKTKTMANSEVARLSSEIDDLLVPMKTSVSRGGTDYQKASEVLSFDDAHRFIQELDKRARHWETQRPGDIPYASLASDLADASDTLRKHWGASMEAVDPATASKVRELSGIYRDLKIAEKGTRTGVLRGAAENQNLPKRHFLEVMEDMFKNQMARGLYQKLTRTGSQILSDPSLPSASRALGIYATTGEGGG